jgi:Subtilisin-like serine proteases
VRGIDTAANLGRVVINLSLGSTEFDQILEDVVFSAFRRGAVIVAAAGNSGANGPLSYPANFPHVLTVAAADTLDRPADFSSASQGVDLIAPGVTITVAVPLLYDVRAFQSVDGTSFSAPIVSGGTALAWTVRSDLDNTQVFDLMRFSARDVWTRGFDPETGFGMLDLPNALARQEPMRDVEEPNDDVRMVKPHGLFTEGTPPLTTPTAARASLHATLDANEDPADLYRLWIPARRTVTVTARSTHAVRVRVWGPRTRSIAETAAAEARSRRVEHDARSRRQRVRPRWLLLRGRAARARHPQRNVQPQRGDWRAREAVAAVQSAHATPGLGTRTVTDSTGEGGRDRVRRRSCERLEQPVGAPIR